MSPSSSASLDLSTISIPLLSVIVGGVLALLFVADYFRRKRAEVATVAAAAPPPESKPIASKASKPPPARKPHPRSHSHVADKVNWLIIPSLSLYQFSLDFLNFFFRTWTRSTTLLMLIRWRGTVIPSPLFAFHPTAEISLPVSLCIFLFLGGVC